MRDLTFERGLPAVPDVEMLILGSILLDFAALAVVGGALRVSDFSLDKHKRIYSAMLELNEAGTAVDRITVARLLQERGQLESVDGIAYLNSLDNGLPEIYNLGAYAAIVKEKSVKRQLILQWHAMIERTMMDNEPAASIVKGAERALFDLDLGGNAGDLLTPEQVMDAYPGGYSAFLDPLRRIKGLQTGFHRIDDMTAGLHAGDLVIVAGRPAMGKTALAMNIAADAAERGKVVAIFSLEMSNDQLITRMICAEARVDLQRFRLGYLSRDERTTLQGAAAMVSKWPLFVTDRSDMSVLDIMARCRRLKQTKGLDLIVIDYLQLMGGKSRENRTQEVSGISRALKLMAKDLQTPVLALSQLNRSVETRPGGNHRPQLSDLRESGSLEQDADAVWFIFRPEYYKPEETELKGIAEVIVAKQRNGPTGIAKMQFLKQFAKFENREDQEGLKL